MRPEGTLAAADPRITDAPGSSVERRPDAGAPSGLAPPAPSDALAWALAFLPLLTALGFATATIAGLNLALVSWTTFAGSAALVVLDKRDLARTGRLPRPAAPSTAWFLFPPCYLLRRARAMGASRTLAWISLACLAVSFAARLTIVIAATASLEDADPVLPGCADRASMQDVLNVFDDIPAVRSAGIRGVILMGQTEVGQGPGAKPTKRYCTGRIRASNTEDYDVNYDLELEQGQVVIELEVP